jgi:hypothetical protein
LGLKGFVVVIVVVVVFSEVDSLKMSKIPSVVKFSPLSEKI